MITPSDEGFILARAYVPEHLPGYVGAISRAEPHLLGDHLCFCVEDALIFNGYPLGSSFRESVMLETLDSAVSIFQPKQVALIAPAIPHKLAGGQSHDHDAYYRLELSQVHCDAKLRNMLHRAARELRVDRSGQIGDEHGRLVSEFLDSHPVSDEIRYILARIPVYASSVPTAQVFSARNPSGTLVAFDMAEFGARDYAFYQFNFRSREYYVPGASDLLLHEVIMTAQRQGKRFLNLGLGINDGIRHFKEKWGGNAFLSYEYCRYAPEAPTLLDVLLQKL